MQGALLDRITRKLAVLDSRARLAAVERGWTATLARLAGGARRALHDPRKLLARMTRGKDPAATEATGSPRVTVSAPRTVPGIAGRAMAEGSGPTKRPLPIVFVHRSNSEHLQYSLAQAKHSNPDSTVFLLGDASNDVYDFVDHRDLRDYFGSAAGLGKIYKHYSTHGVEFELICFQRWFILRDFLVAHGLDRCLYLDSDVMLYTDVTNDARKFDEFDFTLCWDAVGCVFFLNRLQGLEQFCEFVTDIYSKKEKYQYDRMVSHFAVRTKHGLPGGACDMTAFQFFREINFGQVGEASRVIDGSVYDPNINMPNPGFVMDHEVKKITWRDRQPYGTYVRTGQEVRFNSLHFNGSAKRLMRQYYTPGF
jgi:hypothetical protein